MNEELPAFEIVYRAGAREWIIKKQERFTSYDLRYPHPEPGLKAAIGYIRWLIRDQAGAQINIHGLKETRTIQVDPEEVDTQLGTSRHPQVAVTNRLQVSKIGTKPAD